ncbi:hypothetical protein Tco_1164795, partial [Tanacetum coccineum]
IQEAQVEAFEKENVKDENLHGMDKEFETRLNETLCIRSRIVVPMAQHETKHRHLYQQVFDVFKDEGRLPEAIWVSGTTRNTLLEMGKYSHGFYHKHVKDNKLLLHDLGNRDHQRIMKTIQIDDKLHFIEELVKIVNHEVKRLKQSRIPIVKVRWDSRRSPEFTWEREDQMLKKYPQLFSNPTPTSNPTSSALRTKLFNGERMSHPVNF